MANQLPLNQPTPATKAKVSKTSTVLLNDRYKNPYTSLLTFHFDPELDDDTLRRLQQAHRQHHTIEKKDVYLIDHFFRPEEEQQLTHYTTAASFSRTSYAGHDSRDKGEQPAKSMDNKEKWMFFSAPPPPIQQVYKALSLFAAKIDADITTLPWDLCDGTITASAIATNRVERSSYENQEFGKHEDYKTDAPLSFGIPKLYAQPGIYFSEGFTNGAPGKPWLVTLMIYVTAPNFLPAYGMGTAFYTKEGKLALTGECINTRLVLFEGDIVHSIAESHIPSGTDTWRVSYVYKLCFNPRKEHTSMKEAFQSFMHNPHN